MQSRSRFVLLFLVALALPARSPAEPQGIAGLAEGPWGRVEIVPIQIRLPAAMIPDLPLDAAVWHFGAGREAVAEVLREAGVDAALSETLLASYSATGGGALRPEPARIREIPAAARAALYDVLRRSEANTAQRNPHRFRRERLDARFRDLSPETRRLLDDFLYERPSLPRSRLLADLPALTRLIPDPAERARLIQAVSEQESLLMRLQLDPGVDVASLAEYWGRGGRRRDLEILLTSLAEGPSESRLDLMYLLPSFARGFLLTYPHPDKAAARDCFWTALNFFLPSPDDRLVGPRADRLLVDAYGLVEGPLQLGDVLMLWRPSGEAEHAAVYIAGDVYFTKNGASLAAPWLLMRLEDILDRYDEAERDPLTHYRLKALD